MADDKRTSALPIYVSYLTFVTMLDWLREMRVLPSQLDRSLWEKKFSGSVGGQLVPGLRFLHLLDGDSPTPALEQLALAGQAERKTLMQAIIKDAYGEDLIEQLPRMTPKMLTERITALGATASTTRKALSFFVNAAKAADIAVPTAIAKGARNRSSGVSGTRPPRKDPSKGTPPKNPQQNGKRKVEEWSLHPMIVALLRDLEAQGPKWAKEQRETWTKTFQAGLDYAYPAKE